MIAESNALPKATGTVWSDPVPAVVEPLLEAQGDPVRLKAALCKAVEDLGFEQFVFTRRERLRQGIGSRWTCWGSVPVAWADLARVRNFVAVEPIRRSAYQAAVPLVWDQRRIGQFREAREYFANAASFGKCSGVSMAVYTGHRRYVDFFDVYGPTRTITDAHRKEIARRMTDLWALGAYGYSLLPDGALRFPSRVEIRQPPSRAFRMFSHRRPRW